MEPSLPAASPIGQALGVLLFAAQWVLLLRTSWRQLPIGRAVSALLAASLYVAFGLLPPAAAFAAVSLPTLALLTGCMLVSAHAEKAGAFDALAAALLQGGGGRAYFLLRVSCFSAVASALVTNDSACVLLPPVVIKACRARGYRATPFLIAVATASNIGSACSPIGNPQNMIIASASGASFRAFLAAIGIAAALALCINTAVIVFVHREEFLSAEAVAPPTAPPTAPPAAPPAAPAAVATAAAAAVESEPARLLGSLSGSLDASLESISIAAPGEEAQASFTAVTATPPRHAADQSAGDSSTYPLAKPPPSPPLPPAPAAPAAPALPAAPPLRARAVQAILLALPLALIFADQWVGLSWLVLLAGSVLCAVDGGDPDAILAKVDAKLLLFFAGLFASVAGLRATGLPAELFDAALAPGAAALRSAGELLAFGLLVLVGSNTISNVPLVLLLAPRLGAAAAPWLVLAWVSTVAGNLTLLGSVANIIVAEVAAREGEALGFGAYLRVGAPSTLLCLLVLTPLVWALAQAAQ